MDPESLHPCICESQSLSALPIFKYNLKTHFSTQPIPPLATRPPTRHVFNRLWHYTNLLLTYNNYHLQHGQYAFPLSNFYQLHHYARNIATGHASCFKATTSKTLLTESSQLTAVMTTPSTKVILTTFSYSTFKCLHGAAPFYLTEMRVPAAALQHWPSLSSFSRTWRSDGAQNENDNVWITEFCSLQTTCLEWSSTDFAFIIHHTRDSSRADYRQHYFVWPTRRDLALSWLFRILLTKWTLFLLTYFWTSVSITTINN